MRICHIRKEGENKDVESLQRIKTPWEIDGILQEAPKEFTINFQKLLELGAHTGFRVEDHTPWVPGWSFPVAAL
jgi:hypothetical protein